MQRIRHLFAAICFSSVLLYAADTRPNIIVILSDDIGYSDIGCFGGEIATPNLDALATGGLRFTQFYNTGRCCPTRASLLTGLYPHQAGVGYMTDRAPYSAVAMINGWYGGDLRADTATIAEVLRGNGYATYAGHRAAHRSLEGKQAAREHVDSLSAGQRRLCRKHRPQSGSGKEGRGTATDARSG